MLKSTNANIRNHTIRNAEDFMPDIAKDAGSFHNTLNIRKCLFVILAVTVLAVFLYIKIRGFASSDSADSGVSSHEPQIIKKDFEFSEPQRGKNLSHMHNIDSEESSRQAEESSKYQESRFSKKGENYAQNNQSQKPKFEKYRSIKVDTTTENSEANANNSQENNTSIDQQVVFAEKVKTDPNFLIAEGAYIPCSLNTAFVSEVAGKIICTISEDVYSSNGNVKLIEKGSKAIGAYQSGQLQHGVARMFVIWTRLITNDHKQIHLVDTQVVGQLGQAGIEGRINSHFFKRFGGALMLSIVKDVVQTAANTKDKRNNNTININSYDNTKDSFVSIAEKMLDNSINIAPTMHVKQGDIVGILVGKDIDFSKIYKLSKIN